MIKSDEFSPRNLRAKHSMCDSIAQEGLMHVKVLSWGCTVKNKWIDTALLVLEDTSLTLVYRSYFCNTSTEGGVVTIPSLDFRY